MTDMECSECHDLIPELALGVLDGRDRAAALAHVDRCPRCQSELQAMGHVADRLVELTPQAEPPIGFETRTLRRLGSTRTGRPGRRRSRPYGGSLPIARLGVAAALAVAIGLGGWAIGHADAPTGPSHDRRVATAPLLIAGKRAGQVFVSGGQQPAVALAFNSDLGNQTVRCDLVERDGHTTTIATYTLTHGDGYWALPIPVAPDDVTGVRLVDSTGHTLATATLRR